MNYPLKIELSHVQIDNKYAELLFRIIQEKPGNTFSFSFVFNNAPSSPFFPSGSYEKNGFSIGLQPTDLSENCTTLDEWLAAMKTCWDEIVDVFKDNSESLGIDTYPIAVDEKPERVIEILTLMQALSNKYKKSLYCKNFAVSHGG